MTLRHARLIASHPDGSQIFESFASDVGLLPGYWPPTLTIDGAQWSRDQIYRGRDREVTQVCYLRSDHRAMLMLAND